MSREEQILEDLILAGAMDISGIDSETGEFMYKINEKMKDLMPELYEEHRIITNRIVMSLWENGYVDLDFMEDDPLIYLTDKAFDKNEIKKLNNEEKSHLIEIKRIFNT